MIFVDTETDSKQVDSRTTEQVLRFGFACYVRRLNNDQYSKPQWIRFETTEEFWRWLEPHALEHRRLYVFAHNLGFDATVLKAFDHLNDMGFRLHHPIVDDPPTILPFRRDLATITLVDSLNIFRMPLAALGEAMGLAKLEMPKATDSLEAWDTYCMRDCDVLRHSILDFIYTIKSEALGNFKLTLASQAFTTFRHRFMTHDIFIDDNPKALQLSRDGYMGGRTEAFWFGKVPEPVYLLDINSQYPAVMAVNSFPIKLRSVWRNINNEEMERTLKDNSVVADVAINTDRPYYPVRTGSGLVFPVGAFRTTLCSPEISAALERGHLLHTYQGAVYHSARVFRSFVEYFYQKRLEAKARNDGPRQFTYKILMNSLYGKFGQSGRVFEDIAQAEDVQFQSWIEIDAVTGEVYRVRQVADAIQREIREGESTHSLPALAGHVTSGGRQLLASMLDVAGWGNVYYVDTDSLYANAEGYSRLTEHLHATKLGALKLEAGPAEMTIHGAKDYLFDGTSKIKGIKKNAVEVAPGVFEQDRFRGFKGMIDDGDIQRMLVTKTTKHLTRKYKKGKTNGTGRIEPFDGTELAALGGVTVAKHRPAPSW